MASQYLRKSGVKQYHYRLYDCSILTMGGPISNWFFIGFEFLTAFSLQSLYKRTNWNIIQPIILKKQNYKNWFGIGQTNFRF